ncbi:dTDP-4-dehydrorhamnose 3,5-epimerase [Thermithiobacillus plumbiphilus]|uniref:dTDP-4-dehydrorhamnose 3,5-epimerase n=1 Tax=Thermithiobacillus plumbiphilus TaxID=1729899 RepID=A0ABU9D7P6_9PROT
MKFIPTAIPDVIRIEPSVFGDDRGFFMETWEKRKFLDAGITADFVQDNHSRSAQGILRGLHYQVQQPQGKLVRVVSGAVYDVAVDLRRSSPTFGQWVGEVLSVDNRHQLWVPPGFAHGFYVISDYADFVYKCTDYYAPEFERSLRWDDPELGITWPLVDGQPPRLSSKDAKAASLQTAECYP